MQYRSVFRPGAFDDRRIVVTGGGSGIGRCTAHELASLGAFVALVGRNREKLTAVAAEIREAGYRPPTLHVVRHGGGARRSSSCSYPGSPAVQEWVAWSCHAAGPSRPREHVERRL